MHWLVTQACRNHCYVAVPILYWWQDTCGHIYSSPQMKGRRESNLVPIHVFPEMKLLFPKKNHNVMSPCSYTHISVRDLFISTIGLSIPSQTHECGNWDWGRAIPMEYITGIFLAVLICFFSPFDSSLGKEPRVTNSKRLLLNIIALKYFS